MLGLRRGELLGLRWSDVDLEAPTLTVRQNLVRAGGELRRQSPKTRRSRRTLPLPPQVVTALRQQQARQAKSSSGRFILGAQRSGLLRHTCLTLLLSLGTPPHITQASAGHSHVDVTMMIYAHTGMSEQTEALRKLGETFGSVD